MILTIIWSNPTRNLIDRGEFGKGMSFKNKKGCKPANLKRHIEIHMPDKINLSWKKTLAQSINQQFQTDRKATIYFSGDKIGKSRFVLSARNPRSFSNQVANGILHMRADYSGKNHIENITVKSLLK